MAVVARLVIHAVSFVFCNQGCSSRAFPVTLSTQVLASKGCPLDPQQNQRAMAYDFDYDEEDDPVEDTSMPGARAWPWSLVYRGSNEDFPRIRDPPLWGICYKVSRILGLYRVPLFMETQSNLREVTGPACDCFRYQVLIVSGTKC